MGKIERLLTGRDCHVRSALVRVKAGNSVRSQWKQPLQRLYPLEVQHQVDSSATEQEDIQIEVVKDEDIPTVVTGSSV